MFAVVSSLETGFVSGVPPTVVNELAPTLKEHHGFVGEHPKVGGGGGCGAAQKLICFLFFCRCLVWFGLVVAATNINSWIVGGCNNFY